MATNPQTDWPGDEGDEGAQTPPPVTPQAMPPVTQPQAMPQLKFGGDPFPESFDEKFPTDLKAALAILTAVRSLPTSHKNNAVRVARANEKVRRERLIAAHITKLQNGETHPTIDANAQAKAQKNHADIIKRDRRVALANHDPVAKDMLAEIDRQAKTIVQQANEIAALKETISKIQK